MKRSLQEINKGQRGLVKWPSTAAAKKLNFIGANPNIVMTFFLRKGNPQNRNNQKSDTSARGRDHNFLPRYG